MAKPLFITRLKKKVESYQKDFKREVAKDAERLADASILELRQFLADKKINYTNNASENLYAKKIGIKNTSQAVSIQIHSRATSEEGEKYFTRYLVKGEPRDVSQSIDRLADWVKKKYKYNKSNPEKIARKLNKRFMEVGANPADGLEDKIKELNDQFVSDMRDNLDLIRDRVWQRNFRKSRAKSPKTPPAPF